ncbi:MAG: glycosyltransferase family 4 protein [Chloroflexota bacterium]
MRVAHVVAHSPFNEGTGTVAYYYAKGLQDLGVDVEVFVPDKGVPQKDYDQSIYCYFHSFLSIQNAFLTPDLLKLSGFDLVHLHNPYIFGSELILLNLVRNQVPLVVTYHNDLIGRGVKGVLFLIYQKIFTPLLFKRADWITFNSFDHAESSIFYEKIFKDKRDQLVEVPSGVDVESFKPGLASTKIREQFGFSNKDVVVLFVSSLDRAHVNKGLFFLLEAISKLCDIDALKLLVIGGGEMLTEYQSRASELGIADKVKFSGRILHHQLPKYYNAGNLVVIPSIAESFGLAVAEGMACGLPAIATNNPGVRMVIQDNVSGFLVPYDDVPELAGKIRELVENPQLRKKMGVKGRKQIANNFTWKKSAKKLLNLYQELLPKSGSK